MKIIHIAPNSPYHGGAETVAGQLCEQLAQRKHNITWYSLNGAFYNGADKMFGKGFSIKEFKPLLGDPFYIPPREFVRKLKQERADVIHIHNVHTLLPLLVLLFKNNFSIKIVLQPHYHIRGQNFVRNKFFFIYKTLLNLLILNFSAVVVNSKFEQISFVKDFPKISPKLILVPEEYSIEIPDSMTWRPTEKPKKILYVGTLKKYKNVDKLIQAFKILTSKYAGLELIIVGKGTQKEELEALALNLAVADDIVWKNDLDYTDLLNEYAEASVVVHLSELESFSRVVHEAIAVGTPLVVYDHDALGLLAKKGLAKGVKRLDPEEIAATLEDIVIKNCWNRKRQEFQSNDQTYIGSIEKVYHALVHDPTGLTSISTLTESSRVDYVQGE